MALKYPDKVKKLAVSGANTTPDSTAFKYSDILDMKNFIEHDTTASKIAIALNKMMLNKPNISYDSLHTIHCPVLIMAGDHDVIKLQHTLKIFQSIPGPGSESNGPLASIPIDSASSAVPTFTPA